MTKPEQSGKSPYKQFSEGDELCFDLNKIHPDGSVSLQTHNARIEAVRGGGFFGQVLLLQGLPFVLKTGIPGDPWYDFWRRVNWGARDFPYQVSEFDAKLGQVKTDLIHETVSPLTQGEFYAPRSFGYASLPGTFVQAIERLHGRPPRYDNHNDEYQLFRQAQAKITDIGYKLGFEHVGQVHTDNPFAMANLWRSDGLERWEWFDTLPAIRHTGWVWPFFHFGFHGQIRQRFYPDTKEVTFDKIHIDKMLETVKDNRSLFDEMTYARIQENATLYRRLVSERGNTTLG